MEENKEPKLVHLYCGDGKGKTTAAIGLAIRAAGCGKKVLFTQFMKGGRTGELSILQEISNITVLRSQKDFPFYRNMTEEQKAELTQIHEEILQTIQKDIQNGKADLVVLDEITYPYSYGLVDAGGLERFLREMKGEAELVLTGRNPAACMLEAADYITEMKGIRHPYERGITAREGIEY